MTQLATVTAGAGADTVVNQNLRAVSAAGLYGIRQAATSGLVLGYFGGAFNGVDVADGTVTLTASATNYVVANRTTGAVTAATSTTNWLDTTNYMQLYQLVAAASTFTIAATSDRRQTYGGTGSGSGSAAGSDKQIQYNNGGAFGAEAGFEYDQSTNTATIPNCTFTGLALTAASASGGAGLRVPHGVAPSSPANGDMWTTTAGLYARINGLTIGPFVTSVSGMTNPLTTTGDIIYSSSGTTPARLGIGSTNQVLTVISGVPSWQNASSGFANPMTTAGDIIAGGASGAAQRLAAGTNGYVLTMVSGAPAWAAASSGALTNFTESVNSSSPNGTIPVVRLIATNAATNVDVALAPKGSGALLSAIPDGTSTGGNKRGVNAVDWQTLRSGADNVASGDYSSIIGGAFGKATNTGATVIGGESNLASGQHAVAGGRSCTASANRSVAIGESCTASNINATSFGISNTSSGGYSFTVGSTNTATTSYGVAMGYNCRSDGAGSFAMGQYADVRTTAGVRVWAGGQFATRGDAQIREGVMRISSTNATPVELTTDGGAASGATNRLVPPSNSAAHISGRIVARDSAGNAASWDFKLLAKNVGGTLTIVGQSFVSAFADAGAAAWTAAASVGSPGIIFSVTGAAVTTIKWVSSFESLEVVG